MRALALAVWLVPVAAAAQNAPADPARLELIAQAEAASAAGDHTAAVSLGDRAAALRMTPSLMVFLAREHRALGHWVEALDLARTCLRAAEADTALRNRAVILQACDAVRAQVEPRVARLEVACDAPPEAVALRVGARDLPLTLLGVAVPVMPGEVEVTASAPGHATFAETLHLAEGARGRVVVRLAPLAPPAPVTAVALPTEPPAPLPVRSAPAFEPRLSPPPRSIGAGPWLLGGTAVVAGALAGVFYGLAMSARGERDAACDAAGCLPDARDADARYADQLAVGNAAAITGAVLLAGAAAWYVVARVTSPRPVAHGATGALTLRF
ncbi:MAG: hypothetical protein U0325_17790 [Polyangiales bacterium]